MDIPADITVPVMLSLRESCFGKHMMLNVRRYNRCPACKWKISCSGCRKCGGTGLAESYDVIPVNIPAGIDDGMKLIMKDSGNLRQNRTRGRLILEIHVQPDPMFVRDGSDIICEMMVTPDLARNGGLIKIPFIDGDSRDMQISPMTKNGQMFRVRGRGAFNLREGKRGDFYLKVKF